jgi:hypothetical protein
VGEHGRGVKVKRGDASSREKGTPEGIWGVAEGLTKFLSPLGVKHSLFAAKELTVCFAKATGGRCVRMRRSFLWRDFHSSSNQWFMGKELGVGL